MNRGARLAWRLLRAPFAWLGPGAASSGSAVYRRTWLLIVAAMIVANAAGAAVVWATTRVRLHGDGVVEVERPVLGGSHRMVQAVEGGGPVVVLGKPARPPGGERAAGVRVRRVATTLAPGAVRVLGHAGERPQGVALGSARVVVAIGRGIGGFDIILEGERRPAGVDNCILAASVVDQAGRQGCGRGDREFQNVAFHD